MSAKDISVYSIRFNNSSEKTLKLRVWQFTKDSYKEYKQNPDDNNVHYVQSHIVDAKGEYHHDFLGASGAYRLIWKSFDVIENHVDELVTEGEIEFSSYDENKVIEISKNNE